MIPRSRGRAILVHMAGPVRSGLLGSVGLGVMALACQATVDFGGAGDPLPDPTPTPWLDPGDGRDGDLTVSSVVSQDGCRKLIAAATTSGEIAATAGIFQIGDRVLLHQVREDDRAVSGDATALGEVGLAGAWEIARLTALDVGSTVKVQFDRALSSSYGSAGMKRAQICAIPEYHRLTIGSNGVLRASAWNGEFGGLLVLSVQEELFVAGSIRADGAGFRGGKRTGGTNASNVTGLDYLFASGNGGGKGEGLDPYSYDTAGRGNRGNAGGGGNASNGGGGGGGNGGSGGFGGYAFSVLDPSTRGGPGAAVAVTGTAYRLFFGAGGGAGSENNSVGTAGAAGGGVVFVVAGRLAGNGYLSANGASAADAANDGAGGGGAGGTIAVWTYDASAFSGQFRANGGNGGGCVSNHGPGGGGGAGRVHAPKVGDAVPAALSAGVAGTAAGDVRGATGGGVAAATESSL